MLPKSLWCSLLLTWALVLSGLTCASTWGAEETEEPERFVSKEKGFSIVLPKGWKQKEGDAAAVIAFSPPDGPKDQFSENINVIAADLPEPMSVDAVAKAALAHARRLLTDQKVLGQGSLTIGGNETRWWSFEHRMGSLRLKAQQFLFVNGARYCVITCTASPRTFARYKPHFEKSVKSFRFEE